MHLDWSFSHPWPRTWVDQLEPFYWEILLTCCCSTSLQNMLCWIWWVWGSERVGEADLVVLICRWDMSTDLVQWDEVLGIVAPGYHQVMCTLRIGGVITGSLKRGQYCTWSVSGMQVCRVGVFHELW